MANWNDIEQGQVNGSDSINVERGGINVEQLKFTLNTSLWRADSPLPSSCCIFRVPEVLRRQKEQAYEPDIVSIGPFHRGTDDAKFKLVENVKLWYLKCLLRRMTSITLDSLIERMKELGREARGCYSDPCNDLDQNDFIRMLILDGCFLIELFRKARHESRQDYDDPIFNAPCMLEYLYHDLLLLENQLPWFVLEFFYGLIEGGNPAEPLSIVVINFFRDSVADPSIFSYRKPEPTPEILHIVDLIRTSLVQEHTYDEPEDPINISGLTRLTNHLPQRIPTAASLSEAGVKFRKPKELEAGSPGGCILNITFKDGVFTIPSLTIDKRTDLLFRNFMAYEQCYHSCSHKITSYAVLMDNLIDTAEDVDLLCEEGIVANWLSSEDASKFFNDLYDDTTVIDFVYKRLCEKVNVYHEARWNRWTTKWIRWKNKLRSDYFDTPWSIISFFAAFVLLVLTFLQTVYTIQQYHHSPN